MARPTIDLLAEGDPRHGWVLRSPSVGSWSDIPEDGATLSGAGAGVLVQGNRRLRLRLPAGVRGVVAESPRSRRRVLEVEWGQTLFRLLPLAARAAGADAAAESAAGRSTGLVLRAPTDGVFYSRSAPTAAPFAAAGQTVRRGQPVGLVEVMKTFNQILFEGDDLPDQAVVDEILVGDGVEVRCGDALLRLREP